MSAPRPLSWWQRFRTDRLLDGRLSARAAARLREKIAADPAWRAHYDALRRAERGDAALSSGQRALLEDLILGDPRAQPAPARKGALRWMVPAGALGAAAVAVALFLPGVLEKDDGWTARSGGEALGFAVTCLAGDPPRAVDQTGAAVGKQSALSCPAGTLVFAAQNKSDAPVYVFVIARDAAGAPRSMPPFNARSLEVPAAAGDHLFATGAKVDFAGTVELRAIFSPAPLERAVVERAVRKTPRGARLKLDKTRQARVDVRGAEEARR